jgi:hypothetical protein
MRKAFSPLFPLSTSAKKRRERERPINRHVNQHFYSAALLIQGCPPTHNLNTSRITMVVFHSLNYVDLMRRHKAVELFELFETPLFGANREASFPYGRHSTRRWREPPAMSNVAAAAAGRRIKSHNVCVLHTGLTGRMGKRGIVTA